MRAVLHVTKTDRWLKVVAVVAACSVLLLTLEIAVAFYENKQRLQDNQKTALALCAAAGGARDFWIKVRASVKELLEDPNLSMKERSSNEKFKAALTEVIVAADGVAHNCD